MSNNLSFIVKQQKQVIKAQDLSRHGKTSSCRSNSGRLDSTVNVLRFTKQKRAGS